MNSSVEILNWESVRESEDTVVTLGNFDGVHLGHQKILADLKNKSEQLNLKPLIVSYSPHPRKFFKKESISLLTPLEEKKSRLNSLGFHNLYFIQFDENLASLSPEQFYQDFLVKRLRAKALVLGSNHRFGKNAAGDSHFLRQSLSHPEENLVVVEPIQKNEKIICSTEIRSQLTRGEVDLAADFLGYSFTYQGVIIRGDGRGKLLGYPTANLEIQDPAKIMVKYGVYGGRVTLEGQKYAGIVNIGKKPTFPSQNVQIEVHILNFNGDIYGKYLDLELHFFLRNEKLFKSGESLASQIQVDLHQFTEILKKGESRIL